MMNEHEIEPWVIVAECDDDQSLAMWRLSENDQPSLALFSSAELAQGYARAQVAAPWKITQPSRSDLLRVMIECYRKKIELAVLDPDGTTAKRIFMLRDVLKAARDEMRSSTGDDVDP